MNAQYHGGQDNNLQINFIKDFSVTTNFIGSNQNAIHKLYNDNNNIEHYPPQTYQPYIDNLKKFLFKNFKINDFIIIGNGASELIDLVIRSIKCETWKPSYSDVQYLEYERVCLLTNKKKCNYTNKNTDLTCIINPNNPTGDFLSVIEIKEYINKYCKNNSYVIVDESMIPWYGEQWRQNSLISESDWIKQMANNNSIFIFIIHSWTKFFSCTGLRYGSLICPNESSFNKIHSIKIPWSVNNISLKYIDYCINDTKYMKDIWDNTSILRDYQCQQIKSYFPNWDIYGANFLSWIWIDTHNEDIALLAYNLCKYNGTPIRLGKFGYNKNSYLRIAVKEEKYFDLLLNSLKSLSNLNMKMNPIHLSIDNNIINRFEWISKDFLKCHEEYIQERHDKLYEYVLSIKNNITMPAIIVCSKTFVIIDGHHRFSVMKKIGLINVPCLLINYENNNILTGIENSNLNKQKIIEAGINKKYLEPKSSQHMIKINNKLFPIQVLSPIVLIKQSDLD